MPAAQQKKPTPTAEGTDLGDEYLFYDRDGDRVHVLNGTAREIFLMCDGTRTEEEVAVAFADHYDAGHTQQAREDALDTIRRFYDLGLLRT